MIFNESQLKQISCIHVLVQSPVSAIRLLSIIDIKLNRLKGIWDSKSYSKNKFYLTQQQCNILQAFQ